MNEVKGNQYSQKTFVKYFLEYIKYILNSGTNELYKYKISNSHTLIDELIYYIELGIGKEIFNNNIIQICKELYLCLLNDKILKSKDLFLNELIKPFINELKRISEVGKNGLSENIKKELLTRLKSIKNKFDNSYSEILKGELNDLLIRIKNEKITGKTFEIFENLINSYITEVLYRGISKRELTNIIYEIDEKELINQLNNVEFLNKNFFNRINKCLGGNNVIISYLKIYFKNDFGKQECISLLKTKCFVQVNKMNKIDKNDLYSQDEYEAGKVNEFFISKEEGNFCIFKYNGKGIDHLSQINYLKKIIDNVVDFLKWEYPKSGINLSSKFISYCMHNSKYYVSHTYLDSDGYRHEGDSEYLNKRLELFKKLSSGSIDENIEGKLFTMLKYYRLGLTATTYEERFLNLWIGWEHIFSNNLSDKTGWNNILKYVPKILVRQHINNNLWLLIKGELNMKQTDTYGKNSFFFNFLRINKTEKEVKLQPSCYLYMFLQDEKVFEKLLAAIGNNLIARGKILAIRNGLYINDNKKIGEKTVEYLNNYENNVMFELFRMNRIRNSIVHRGKNDFKFLDSITNTLEKYYLIILEDILDHFTNRNGFSIDDYFLRTENSYNTYLNEIKSDKFKSADIKTRGKILTYTKVVF